MLFRNTLLATIILKFVISLIADLFHFEALFLASIFVSVNGIRFSARRSYLLQHLHLQLLGKMRTRLVFLRCTILGSLLSLAGGAYYDRHRYYDDYNQAS